MEQLGSQWTDIMIINTWLFFKNLLRISIFNENLIIITDILHDYIYSLLLMSRGILLTINVSGKVGTEKQNTQFIFSNIFENVPL
jgi:hypothetical protein